MAKMPIEWLNILKVLSQAACLVAGLCQGYCYRTQCQEGQAGNMVHGSSEHDGDSWYLPYFDNTTPVTTSPRLSESPGDWLESDQGECGHPREARVRARVPGKNNYNCIVSKIFCVYPQEHLLLSVMPAYIAAEVKRSLMLKMTDSYSAQQRQTAQFQDLFVQRHSNVRSQAAGGHLIMLLSHVQFSAYV